MSRKITTEEFIAKSKNVHGDDYDYSNTIYLKSTNKVIITCKVHGDFFQLPCSHISGKGCVKCGHIKKAINHSITRNNNRKNHTIVQSSEYKLIPTFCGTLIKVDNDDYDKLKHINWALSYGYAVNSKVGFMHRLIFGDIPNNMVVDHIDSNPLNNTRKNLRLATTQQNIHNNSAHKKNKTSKYKGVSWNKKDNKWVALIAINGKQKHLGRFKNQEDAAIAYNIKAQEFFGEFAKINIIL